MNNNMMVRNLPLGEDLLDFVSELLSGVLVGKFVFRDDLLEFLSTLGEFSGNLESSWENMVVVDDFGEWLQG